MTPDKPILAPPVKPPFSHAGHDLPGPVRLSRSGESRQPFGGIHVLDENLGRDSRRQPSREPK